MKRVVFALLIVASLLLAPTAAFAQDELPIACGTLSEEDCDFLKESRDATMAVASTASRVEMAISLTNVPQLPEELALDLVVDGQFQLDPELAARGMELQLKMADDPTAAAEEMMAYALDIYANLMMNMDLDLSLSDDLTGLLSAQAGLPLPSEWSFPVRMSDGFVYFNLDDVGEAVGDSGLAGWLGMDMAGLMEKTFAQMEEDPAFKSDPMMMGAIAGQMQSQMALSEAAVQYTDVERLEDVEVDGVDAAQFFYTFDLAGFIASPEFGEMLKGQLEMQMSMQEQMGGEAPPMSDADMQMALDMLPMVGPMLLSGVKIGSVSTIGLEDKLVRTTETDVEWELGTVITMAGAMMQGQATRVPRGADAPVFTMHISGENSAFDEEFEVEVPEDAQIIPLESMMQETM